jgi:hypothetical protein
MNYVTSCHQVASVTLNAPVGKIWETLKTFDWAKFLPSHVKSTKFISGSPNEIGSTFEVEYVDGSVWQFRIVEISELNRSLSYELISANPQTSFTSMLNHVRLHKITFDDSTYVEWSTDFSNDVDSHVVQDNKFKKNDYFKDLRKLFP